MCRYFVVLIFVSVCTAQDIFETVEAVVGHTAELPCNVTAELEDDKLNILAWYKNGSANAFYRPISSRDLRGGAPAPSAGDEGGRFALVTGEDGLDLLQILAVVPGDAGVYQCLADFAASPAHKTFVQLNVIEPPRNLWVVHENSTQVAKTSAGANVSQNIGPYYVGDTVRLFCVAFGGRPKPILSWHMDQRVFKETYTPLSEHRVRSDLIYGPLRPEDHGRVFSCQASNNQRTTPLTIDIVIDMYLPPQLVSLRAEGAEGGRVKAGAVLALSCRVLGARPPPPIVWRLGDTQLLNMEQNITNEPSQRLVMSEVQLTVDSSYDESTLSCCAPAYTRGEDKFVCSDKLPLTVLYPPALAIVLEEDAEDNNTLTVTKGSDVRMACTFQANPAVYQLIWFHEDDIMGEKKDSSETVQAMLELPSVTESDAGEYVCAGTNDEGSSYSEPVRIDVIYPPYCEDETVAEYGLGDCEEVNITCVVKANPPPTSYRWVLVDANVNITGVPLASQSRTTLETDTNVLLYERPNNTGFSNVFCWGVNDVKAKGLTSTPCTFVLTDETAPRPLSACEAVMDPAREIYVKCTEGHNGGLPQKFKFIVQAVDSEAQFLSITTMEPQFMVPEPKVENYKFVITAFNEKGESKPVEIAKDEIVDKSEVPEVPVNAVADITTLALALCGGVLLVALAACGLVLCARDEPPPLTGLPRPIIYHTEESNCETYGSEDESECMMRRSESFRRAVGRHPQSPRRSGSFAARDERPLACRVHSLQNISRRRDDCDHLVLRLPPDHSYSVARPMNTFYTMPRKTRQKPPKEISDEVSEITQTSDGFSLPPPPDEFGTYRAATRIKDIPIKTTPSYTTIKRNNSMGKDQARMQYTTMSPMNTVGLPTVSGTHALYAYSDDDHHQTHHQVNATNPFDEDSP